MEALVCASCPEKHHERVSLLCRQHGIQKAFGKAGDMVNDLSGKDWIPKWEAKVVIATVTKATTLGAPRAKILCIAGGRHCNDEMARQPKLVQAIKKEMEDPSFRVSVEWLEMEDFLERYPEKGQAGKTSNDSKHVQAVQSNDGGGCSSPTAEKQGGKGKAGTKEDGSETSKPPPAGKAAGQGKAGPQDKGKPKGQGKGGGGKNFPAAGSGGQGPVPGRQAEDADAAALCRHFAQGHCKFGKACTFLHQASGLSQLTQIPTPCRYFAQGSCKFGSGCKNLHHSSKGAKAGAGANAGREASNNKKKQQGTDSKKRVARTLPCLECGRKFEDDWLDMMGKHWWCNGREPLFVCAECGRSFECWQHCEQHQGATGHQGRARRNDGKDPVWPCQQCNKPFSSPEARDQHQRMVGHGNTPTCAVCDRAFQSEKSLLQHQQSTSHTGVVWFIFDDGDSVPSDSDESAAVEDPSPPRSPEEAPPPPPPGSDPEQLFCATCCLEIGLDFDVALEHRKSHPECNVLWGRMSSHFPQLRQ